MQCVRLPAAAVLAAVLALGAAGCGDKSGGPFSGGSDDDGTTTSAAAPTAPTVPAPPVTTATTPSRPAPKPIPKPPSTAQLVSGKAACDLGPPVSVEFPELTLPLSLGDVLDRASAGNGKAPDALPVRPILSDGDEVGRVSAASFEMTPTGAKLKKRYLGNLTGTLSRAGVKVKRTRVAGKPAVAYRRYGASTVTVAGTCRVWTVAADAGGATARAIAGTMAKGEAG